ncbi:MAG: CpsD/CapB family tyrosine-protein kinase [Oscillospiraceae bacterium]
MAKIVKNSYEAAADQRGTNQVPFAIVESYKTIRTNLTFMLSQSKSKCITVSSSVSGEGKSTSAVNLAIAFSQLGSRVLLIDADLRKPTIYKKMKISNAKGLSSLLVGFCNTEEAIIGINANLDVLTSGPIPPNPSELLGSESMTRLLDVLKGSYEYIIIDTPPINIVSDALVLAPKTNGVLLVAQDYSTTHDQVRKSLGAIEFANVKMLGVVLNASSKGSRKSYKSRYKYSYYYGK